MGPKYNMLQQALKKLGAPKHAGGVNALWREGQSDSDKTGPDSQIRAVDGCCEEEGEAPTIPSIYAKKAPNQWVSNTMLQQASKNWGVHQNIQEE